MYTCRLAGLSGKALAAWFRTAPQSCVCSHSEHFGGAQRPTKFPGHFPPSFRQTSLSLAFDSHADLTHRQCFDREDSQWVTSPSVYADWSAPGFSPHPTHTPELFVEIVTDGWHYNRPPPIS